MIRVLLWVGLAILPLQGSFAAEFIEFESVDGRVIEAKVIKLSDGQVTIKRQDGRTFEVSLDQFSESSQQVIKSATTSETDDLWLDHAVTLNELFGIPLFGEEPFWGESFANVIERIRWPKESETETSASYRIYPPENARILGRRPYSAVFYVENDRPDWLSVVFANKGDSYDSEGSDSKGAVLKMIEADGAAIEDRLTDVLGDPERQTFGEGRKTRQRLARWDLADIAILLANVEGEYVSVMVVPEDLADKNGRRERFSDADVRKAAKSNVVTRENGDVVISNIPMVDQGPKGYCVPATFERYLRYMGISCDMYLLALAGKTEIGGGTITSDILEGVSSLLSRNNRSLETLSEMPELRLVQKYINEGRPIMWTLFSSDLFNQLSNERRRDRAEVTDWKEWVAHLRDFRRQAQDYAVDIESGHMAMIIGYNATTGEIAFSDSWGPAYTERWLTEEEIVAFSQGRNYLIDF